MKTKGLVCTLTAFLLITCSRADIWEETEELLDRLNDVVQDAIRTSWGEIGVLQRNIVNAANNVSIEARAQIDESATRIRSQMDYLEVLADAFGVIHCTEGRREQFDVVAADIQDDIMECINRVTGLAVGIMSNAGTSISAAQTRVYALRLKFEDCQEREDTECVIVVREEIYLGLDELPTGVLDQMIVILTLTLDSEQSIHDCADHRVGLIYVEGNKFVLQMENCLINEGLESELWRKQIN